jgi:hypothetical protein
MIIYGKGGSKMSFDNLLTLLIIGGLGYMMFRGGGCCGSHGSHGKHESGGKEKDEKTVANPDEQGSADR